MEANWKVADTFDAELFRLLSWALRNSEQAAKPHHVEMWKDVYRALNAGRINVRRMMREQDRAITGS